jgi:hypothetical protein
MTNALTLGADQTRSRGRIAARYREKVGEINHSAVN